MVEPVTTHRAFSALSHSRVRARSGPLWIVCAETQPAGAPDAASGAVRVAYAIGRSVGSAVVRNRLRRRLRAVIADLERTGALAPGLYLIGARPSAATASFDSLRADLHHAVAALAATADGGPVSVSP